MEHWHGTTQKLQKRSYLFSLIFLSSILLCMLDASPCQAALERALLEGRTVPFNPVSKPGLTVQLPPFRAVAAPVMAGQATSEDLTYRAEQLLLVTKDYRVPILTQLNILQPKEKDLTPEIIYRILENILRADFLEDVAAISDPQQSRQPGVSQSILQKIWEAYPRTFEGLVADSFVYSVYRLFLSYLGQELARGCFRGLFDRERPKYQSAIERWATSLESSTQLPAPLSLENGVLRALPSLLTKITIIKSFIARYTQPLPQNLRISYFLGRIIAPLFLPPEEGPEKKVLPPRSLGALLKKAYNITIALRKIPTALLRQLLDDNQVKKAFTATTNTLRKSPAATVCSILDFLDSKKDSIDRLVNAKVMGVTDDLGNIILPMVDWSMSQYCSVFTCSPLSMGPRIAFKIISVLQKLIIAQMSAASVSNNVRNYMPKETGDLREYWGNRIAYTVDALAIPVALSGIFLLNPNDYDVIWWINTGSFYVSFISMGLRLWSIRDDLKQLFADYIEDMPKQAGPMATKYKGWITNLQILSGTQGIDVSSSIANMQSALQERFSRAITWGAQNPEPEKTAPIPTRTMWQEAYANLPSKNIMIILGCGVAWVALLTNMYLHYSSNGEPATTPAI
jgi:hypothetical protein